MKINVIWLRRDLRWVDNTALYYATESDFPVIPLFIFDKNIIDELPKDDSRVQFIHEELLKMHQKLNKFNSGILFKKGNPVSIWNELIDEFEIDSVFFNKDYEPYARERDVQIKQLLESKGIKVNSYKDQVIFEENDIVKNDGKPYTVFTPYKKKWLKKLSKIHVKTLPNTDFKNFLKKNFKMPSLRDIGFQSSPILVKPYTLGNIQDYAKNRDFPAIDSTSYLSVHLRFGTVSIREIINHVKGLSDTFLSELIWREFFMQILYHFPHVVTDNFYSKYDKVKWRNNKEDFERWKNGKTGYPFVDAGMRQLNSTGYMHNRARMIAASFLTKHLLIDWRWGESYFAEKLLDYELSANNGNWQWAAGTGCDAAPYFRVFNPYTQLKKFDPDLRYVKRWIPEYDTLDYPQPMIEHKAARERALRVYAAIKE